MAARRAFSREFKLEPVKLVKDRGVSVAQASRDLDLHENVLRKWVRELAVDPQHVLPGQGQRMPQQAEIERLGRALVGATKACSRRVCGRLRYPVLVSYFLRQMDGIVGYPNINVP